MKKYSKIIDFRSTHGIEIDNIQEIDKGELMKTLKDEDYLALYITSENVNKTRYIKSAARSALKHLEGKKPLNDHHVILMKDILNGLLKEGTFTINAKKTKGSDKNSHFERNTKIVNAILDYKEQKNTTLKQAIEYIADNKIEGLRVPSRETVRDIYHKNKEAVLIARKYLKKK